MSDKSLLVTPPSDMVEGVRHKTNSFGEVKIVKYNSAMDVVVSFIDTGYTCRARADHIRGGRVKDKIRPSMYGVGFIGDGPYHSRIGGKLNKSYSTWKLMMERCYKEPRSLKNKSYKDCRVCDEWHNYQNFAEWYEENYPNDGADYQLDKDIKVKGNRIYSPEHCIFVSAIENSGQSNSKVHHLINPEGVRVSVFNLKKYCRDNDLDELFYSGLVRVSNGDRISYKGWRKGA